MSISLVAVKKRDGEDISSLLKRLKRKVETSGHLNELKQRRYFIKPSMVKRIANNKIEHAIELQRNPKYIKPKKKK